MGTGENKDIVNPLVLYKALVQLGALKRSIINIHTGNIKTVMQISRDVTIRLEDKKIQNLKAEDFLDVTDTCNITGLSKQDLLNDYSFVDYDLTNVIKNKRKLKELNKDIVFYKNSEEYEKIIEETTTQVSYVTPEMKDNRIGGAFSTEEESDKKKISSIIKDKVREKFLPYFIRNEETRLREWKTVALAEYPFVRLRENFYITYPVVEDLIKYNYIKVEHYRQNVNKVYSENEYKETCKKLLLLKK